MFVTKYRRAWLPVSTTAGGSKKPIRLAWFLVAFPALSLSYLGQGAMLLTHPEAVSNPFYQQRGAWSIFPLVAMATIATVIASQATISATFSVTQSAIAMGFLPRMRVAQTSEREIGQVYMPLVSWVQLVAVVAAVLAFGSSTNRRQLTVSRWRAPC